MADVFDRVYLPEEAGIPSISIANFLQDCEKIHYKLRTLHIVRHGKLVAEAARYPFRADDKRLVYSVSKTFTSTAVGLAVQEGLLRVEDKLLDYFPECQNLPMDPRAREITLKDVLTMSTGHAADTTGDICNSENTPWPEVFFTRKMAYAPGERFVYNSGGTYMLSEVISRTTGKNMMAWLLEKFFEPLGITDVSWDVHGDVNTGGWGLLIAPRDLCRAGMLYLNKGVWDGRRILSEEWVREATTPHIATNNSSSTGWGRHYGYQIWENIPGSYRADGAFGQYCMVFPEQDMVVVTTAEEMDANRIFPLVERWLLTGLAERQLGKDAWAFACLQKELALWETPAVYEATSSHLQYLLQNKTYTLQPAGAAEEGHNNLCGHKICLDAANSRLRITVDGRQVIDSSSVTDIHGVTPFVIELPSSSPLLGKEQRSRSWAYSAHHAWIDQDALMVTVCWRETGHNQTWKFQFSGDQLYLWITDGTKQMFDLFGIASDRNVRFCDMAFTGTVQP